MPKNIHTVRTPFQQFVRSESFSGLLLITTALCAFVWANSPWGDAYQAMKATKVGITFDAFSLHKALILWVNDLLMAIFFLMVGLEIKRELKTGELADPQARALPIAAAIGGMVVPALCYVLLNSSGDAVAGWGIPMATDIAFALGIMALLGNRVPVALKVFLTALAIVDDLGAVTVIALFYTENVDIGSLIAALVALAAAFGYKFVGGRKLPIFLGIGLILWYFMLKSGVHATVAGVALAFAIPLRREIEPSELSGALAKMFKRQNEIDIQEAELAYLEKIVDKAQSPLHDLEHGLQPWVAYAIMPIFALFNAGFVLGENASLFAPVSLGVFIGLILGKPIGILACSWIAVAMGKATLPDGIGWRAIFGTSMLAGIGFTMSLFIAALAFSPDSALDDQAKLGVLAASVAAAVIGLVVLAMSLPKSESRD